jgi:hypothetical protein
MHPSISPKIRFNDIVDVIVDERYKTASGPTLDPQSIAAFEHTAINPSRKRKAALRKQEAVQLDGLFKRSRAYVAGQQLTERQGRAIEELLTYKKDELAIRKFLESPKRTFKTQGTEYELVDLGNGRFSCVNKKLYKKCKDDTWESKNGSPKTTFYGRSVVDLKSVQAGQLRPIDELLQHRFAALDMRDMPDVQTLPNSIPSHADHLTEAMLANGPEGDFLVRPSKYKDGDDCTISYKMNGLIVHEHFDRQTGIMENGNNSFPPRTVHTLITELQRIQNNPQPVATRGGASTNNPPRVKPPVAERPVRNQGLQAQGIGGHGPYGRPPRSTDRNAPRGAPTQEASGRLAGPSNHRDEAKPALMSESDAIAEIKKYDINFFAEGFAKPYRGLAVAYRRHDDSIYVLARVKDSNGEARDFKLSYLPDDKTIKYRGRITDIKTFLAGQGIPFDGEMYFLN